MSDLNDPSPWWKHAVCYQVYIRSFADSDGDGVGDLPGITSRLPYLRDLGVDALWITPFYRSPQYDHGYDVAHYRDVDPLFGSLSDADDLLARARELDLKVIVDLVPNHTSSEHRWFQEALATDAGSQARARYLFSPGRGAAGSRPPNNWRSVFGGPAWDRLPATETDPEPEWFLHLFDSTQPDLDWRNPEVPALFEEILRFWLDRGVDGFRIDVAHGLFKEESLRDQQGPDHQLGSGVNAGHGMASDTLRDEPMWDQPEVHGVYRAWREVLESYEGDRMAVAEAWTQTPESMARFVRPDELHQSFNFAWLMADWSAAQFAEVIERTCSALGEAPPTWVLSNHDVVRHVTRYGGGARGLARARAATLAMLGLPGSAYLYQGEELGLEQVDVAPEFRQDPSWFRTGEEGRDGCRVPIPWSGDHPPYGFGPGAGQPWIPQPQEWGHLSVESQHTDPGSTLAFYRRALSLRTGFAETAGDDVEVLGPSPLGEHVLEVRRGPLTILVNCGDDTVALPLGEVVLTSGELAGDRLPPDTAAWLRT